MQQPLRVHAATHEGLVHEKNEDSHSVLITDEGGVLLLVCDGMGGMGRGDVASQMSVEHIVEFVGKGKGFPPERLRRAIREADTAVRVALCGDGHGMPGATAVMVYVLDGMGHVAWAGDSRAYLIRDGKMVERTRDHKLVNELISAGQLSEEEAKHSALAHVVTRALGGRPPSDRPVKASTLGHPWKLAHGDTMVLCSDGVCDLVNDEELATMVTGVPPEQGVKNLVQISLDRGGHDNITCIVATWDGPDYAEDDKATPSFTMRDEGPDRDLRDHVPMASGIDDDGRGVTEEIDANWRPGQDEEVSDDDTGATQQTLFHDGSSPGVDDDDGHTTDIELPVAPIRDPEKPTPVREPAAPHTESSEGLQPMLWLAVLIGVAVLIGLALAVLQ